MALISAVQFRQHYPQLEGTDEDATLDLFIGRADGLMADYTGFPVPDGAQGRTLEQATYTVHPTGPVLGRPKALCLGIFPIVSVTSVDANGTALVEGVDYEVDPDAGILWLLPGASISAWPVGDRVNEVVVEAGFAAPTPPALVAITVAAVRHLWDLRNVQGVSAYGRGGDSATRVDADTTLPASVKAALRRYALKPLAEEEA